MKNAGPSPAFFFRQDTKDRAPRKRLKTARKQATCNGYTFLTYQKIEGFIPAIFCGKNKVNQLHRSRGNARDPAEQSERGSTFENLGEQRVDRRCDRVDGDGFHAACARTAIRRIAERSLAAPQPGHFAEKLNRLVAAGKRIDGHGAIRLIGPEITGAIDARGARTKQRDGRDPDDAPEMRDAGVGTDEQFRVREKMPQRIELQVAGKGKRVRRWMNLLDQLLFARSRAPDHIEPARVDLRGKRTPPRRGPQLEWRARADVQHGVGLAANRQGRRTRATPLARSKSWRRRSVDERGNRIDEGFGARGVGTQFVDRPVLAPRPIARETDDPAHPQAACKP